MDTAKTLGTSNRASPLIESSVTKNNHVDTARDDILLPRAYIAHCGKVMRVSCLSKLMKVLDKFQAHQNRAQNLYNHYPPRPTWNMGFL